MLFEIHMLKNYPATNLNRDDTGAPKTCVFSGVTRGRISSQCLKRSWRTSEVFREEIGESNLGVRTRKLPDLVGDKMRELGVNENYIKEIMQKVTGIANKDGKENPDGYTKQVAFYSNEDIEAVTQAIISLLDTCDDIKGVKKITSKDLLAAIEGAKTRPVTLDIALFGRMVTSDAFRDVEASMQVAHAVSTNRVVLESDYFTAMDDMLEGGDTMESNGSGMIGDIDYNSSCYYSYASIDTDLLRENLKYAEAPDALIKKAIPALLRAMAMSNPSGKQNSFAGHVLPVAIIIECKDKKIPVSYVNAYAEPAESRKLVADSIEKLVNECDMINDAYALPVQQRLWFCLNKYAVNAPKNAVVCNDFSELINRVESAM